MVVMAAAVSDFRPRNPVDTKISKEAGVPELVLEPTQDILEALGSERRSGQVLVGFAAETRDAEDKAAAKLRRKHIDLIVVNDVAQPGVGFEHDTNAVVVLSADGSRTEVALSDKRKIAAAVIDAIVSIRARRDS